jgi:hypothetical protein
VKPSYSANDKLIDRTRRIWQPRLGRDLGDEDARQIVGNLTGFFALLAEWSRAELRSPVNDTGRPTASNKEGRSLNAEIVGNAFNRRQWGGG